MQTRIKTGANGMGISGNISRKKLVYMSVLTFSLILTILNTTSFSIIKQFCQKLAIWAILPELCFWQSYFKVVIA